MSEIAPGVYKNTQTGVEFDVYVGPDEVIIESGAGENKFSTRMDKSEFKLDVSIGKYELVREEEGMADPEMPSHEAISEALKAELPSNFAHRPMEEQVEMLTTALNNIDGIVGRGKYAATSNALTAELENGTVVDAPVVTFRVKESQYADPDPNRFPDSIQSVLDGMGVPVSVVHNDTGEMNAVHFGFRVNGEEHFPRLGDHKALAGQ